jgi:hypothetical protein
MLHRQSQIVNRKCESLPLKMPTQAQNLSREMILPAYKAAILPGPPIPPLTRIENPVSRIPVSCVFDTCREPYTNSPFSCKTNPIFEKPKINATPLSQTTYENTCPFGRQKTNPKRTQTNPIQSQSNSKRSPDPYGSASRNPKAGDQTNAIPHWTRKNGWEESSFLLKY